MKKQLKNKKELFDYLMYGYAYELEEVKTKKGIQKRLKDNELEEILKKTTKENIKSKDLHVELKLGPVYNRTENVWVQLFTLENKSGTKGRYVGISFVKETGDIELWLGFGKNSKKQSEIIEIAKEYKTKYSLIEPNLKYGFEYLADCYDAIFIKKKINIKKFDEEEFESDLKYITDLYKTYEVKFEKATISLTSNKEEQLPINNEKTYEELSERMLSLMEEIGDLAKEMRKLRKNKNI